MKYTNEKGTFEGTPQEFKEFFEKDVVSVKIETIENITTKKKYKKRRKKYKKFTKSEIRKITTLCKQGHRTTFIAKELKMDQISVRNKIHNLGL